MRRAHFGALLASVGSPGALAAQMKAAGLEVRGYPAGLIPTAHLDLPVGGRFFLSASGGYNFTNRRDFGRHDDERGGGPGLGLSLTQSDGSRRGVQWGVRSELWRLRIDWRDQPDKLGATKVLVFQPSARLGYAWVFRKSRTSVDVSIGLGQEINVWTRGERVGEGPILLLGVGIRKQLGGPQAGASLSDVVGRVPLLGPVFGRQIGHPLLAHGGDHALP